MKPTNDTERLDWLEENFQANSFRYVPGWPTMNNSRQGHWSLWAYKEGTTTRQTLREAIDAAVEQTPP